MLITKNTLDGLFRIMPRALCIVCTRLRRHTYRPLQLTATGCDWLGYYQQGSLLRVPQETFHRAATTAGTRTALQLNHPALLSDPPAARMTPKTCMKLHRPCSRRPLVKKYTKNSSGGMALYSAHSIGTSRYTSRRPEVKICSTRNASRQRILQPSAAVCAFLQAVKMRVP